MGFDVLIYLSSGLFLGWSLGANDAANIFGTAVGSKMVRFRTAATIAGIFVILGAGFSGAGAAHTIEKLGSINEIAGAFIVTLAAAVSVYWMTKLHLPVSTSQAVVGAIIGWNLFSGSLTDYNSLTRILFTWIFSPVISAGFSIIMYLIVKKFINRLKVHLLKIDLYNRIGLLIVGAFGSYSLGANNIANVMGVFVPVSPFKPFNINVIVLNEAEQLFIIGGIAIAVGIFTYSYRVMMTVGNDIIKLTPITALIVVLSSSMVLFLFASQNLETFLIKNGLPAIPLVPVSSSQVIVGGIVGIGLIKGGKGINIKVLGKIGSGWITTPVIACLISFTALFFLQNVFNRRVYTAVHYRVSPAVIGKVASENYLYEPLFKIIDVTFTNAVLLKKKLDDLYESSGGDGKSAEKAVLKYSRIYDIKVDYTSLGQKVPDNWITDEQMNAVRKLDTEKYTYSWEFYYKLAGESQQWELKADIPRNHEFNRNLMHKLNYLYRIFTINRLK